MLPITPAKPAPLLEGTLKNLFFSPERDEYQYFAAARDNPFTKGDPVVKAAWAADAAMLCYARYGSVRMSDAELTQNLARGGLGLRAKIGGDIANWNAPGTQAFFATADDFAILAFRGTKWTIRRMRMRISISYWSTRQTTRELAPPVWDTFPSSHICFPSLAWFTGVFNPH